MQYGELLKESWRIFRREKTLWLYGLIDGGLSFLFSVLFIGGVSVWISLVTLFETLTDTPEQLPPEVASSLRELGNLWSGITPGDYAVFAIFSVLFLVFSFYLAAFAKAGIIYGIKEHLDGCEKIDFPGVFACALKQTWKIFLFNLLRFLIVVLILGLFLLLFMILTVLTAGLIMICMAPLSLLMNVFAILFAVFAITWANMTIVALAQDANGFMDGLKVGWVTLRQNVRHSALLGFLNYGITMVISMIVTTPAVLS